MPIQVLAQSSIRSGGLETEPPTETITVEPDDNGVFSHELMGSMTIGVGEEVDGGVTVSFNFGGWFTDAWLAGDQKQSFLTKAVYETVVQAIDDGKPLPSEFPLKVSLPKYFLRRGSLPIELSIMKKPDYTDGSWLKMSKIQVSVK